MSRKLRVLQLGKYYPPHRGGIETHLQSLIRHLKHKVELNVLVASTESRTVQDEDAGVTITRVSTPVHFGSAPICPTLTWHVARAKPDITHIHWPNPMAYMAYKMAGSPGKLVVGYHSDIIRQRLAGRIYQPVLDAMLKEASAIVPATKRYADTSATLRGYQHKVRVIPYGLELDRYLEPDPIEMTRLRQLYPGPVVLAVGRMVYYKGFEYLLEAMRSVDATLILIGSGPLKAKLQAQAEAMGGAGRIHFLNNISDPELAAYYQFADLFALPSVERSESFALVQVEAMASGTPVINTAIDSGVPEVSLHQKTGLTVPPRDSQALAEAINSLLADRTKLARLGRAGVLRAQAEFSAEVMAERTLALYQELVDLPPAGKKRVAVH